MNLAEIMRQALATFRAHRLRTFLTMFGIVWGIVSVILLVGLGKGFNKDQKERWKQLGTNLVIVWGGRTSQQAGGLAAGREIRLTVDDARRIRDECYLATLVSPELSRNLPEVSAYNSANQLVSGIWPDYQEFRSITVVEGRLIRAEDEDRGHRVVVLGYEVRKQLFRGEPAVGAALSLGGVPYTVIGVMPRKKQNSDYSGRDDQHLFVPYSAMARDFPPPAKPGIVRGWISNLVFSVANPRDNTAAIAQVRRTLGRFHHFDYQDEDALLIWDTNKYSGVIARIFDVMTLFFGAVAVTTLCLGGIGVMNIMLVSVTERTGEIGMRKALGATRMDILWQFFAESATLTFVSGLLGFGIGVGFCLAVNAMELPEFLPHPIVSLSAALACIATLAVVTMGAGLYPAQRAAEMTPVEALRHE
jgi:putative ABC transport system permease protein